MCSTIYKVIHLYRNEQGMGQTGQRLYEGFGGWVGMSKERSNTNTTSVLQPDNPFIHLQDKPYLPTEDVL